jgi:quercetin dioxygenase-like cupin family protein
MWFRKSILIICLLFMALPVSAGEYNSGVQSKLLLETTTTSNGQPIKYLQAEKPEITAMEVVIAPGAQTGWHKHPVPVYAYVISGSLSVDIEGSKSTKFNAGDVIIEVVNVRHNGINKGNEPVKLIVFYTGAKDVPEVIKTPAP